jgi:hypothetical protein
VTVDTLMKICEVLDYELADIVEITPGTSARSDEKAKRGNESANAPLHGQI